MELSEVVVDMKVMIQKSAYGTLYDYKWKKAKVVRIQEDTDNYSLLQTKDGKLHVAKSFEFEPLINVNKLKAGDMYFSDVEGWVEISKINKVGKGIFEVFDTCGNYIHVNKHGIIVDIDDVDDYQWNIVKVKGASQ